MTILSTVLTLKDVAFGVKNITKTAKTILKPTNVKAANKLPVVGKSGQSLLATAASVCMTIVSLIPPTFYSVLLKAILGIFMFLLGKIIKILKFFNIIAYLLLGITLWYSFTWLQEKTVVIPALEITLNHYFPNLTNDFVREITYMVIGVIFLFILWFFYVILFPKKQKERITFNTENGFGQLVVTSLPAENTAWGKAFITVFYLSSVSILFYIMLFFKKTLPEIVKTFGGFKTEVVEISRTFTLEEKTEWVKQVKLLLVDADVPAKTITQILRNITNYLPQLHTQDQLILYAQTQVSIAHAKIVTDLKFSFWQDVVLLHPFVFLGIAVVTASSLCYFGWKFQDSFLNEKALHLAEQKVQKFQENQIEQKLAYLAALGNVLAENIRNQAQITGTVAQLVAQGNKNVKEMKTDSFWDEGDKLMKTLYELCKKSGKSLELLDVALHKTALLRKSLNEFGSPMLREDTKDLFFEGITDILPGVARNYLKFAGDLAKAPIKYLQMLHDRKVIEQYEATQLTRMKNGEPSEPVMEFLRTIFPDLP